MFRRLTFIYLQPIICNPPNIICYEENSIFPPPIYTIHNCKKKNSVIISKKKKSKIKKEKK